MSYASAARRTAVGYELNSRVLAEYWTGSNWAGTACLRGGG
jgi:hypothetical protein